MKITLRDNKINLNAQYHFKPQLNSMLSLILLINSVLLLGFKPSDQNSVQFSHSVVSDSLRPHELQYARPPCPSSTPRVYPNSCPLSWWYHQIISSSVIPFSSCPQSFPTSGSSPMSWFFASGGQTVGASASASVLPMKFRVDFFQEWQSFVSLQFKGLSRLFSSTTVWKHRFFSTQPSLWFSSHICTWLMEKP